MPVVDRYNPTPINFKGRGRVRSRGLGYGTSWSGPKYRVKWEYRENATILSDHGQKNSPKGSKLAELRGHYSGVVGRTREIREAGNDLFRQARANALLVRESRDLWRGVQRPVRDGYQGGAPIDWVVWSTDKAAYQIEFGARGVPGAFVMMNAAKGRGPNKKRLAHKASTTRANVRRKSRR